MNKNVVFDFMKEISEVYTYEALADVINDGFIHYTGALACWCVLIDTVTNQVILQKIKTSAKLEKEIKFEISEIQQTVNDLHENFNISDIYEYLMMMSENNKIFVPVIHKNKMSGYVGLIGESNKFHNTYVTDVKIILGYINSRFEIISLLDEMQKTSKARTKFLASISHEFKTPLNSIMGFSDLLMERVGANEGKLLKNISQSAVYLTELIQAILDCSEYKPFNLQFEKFRPKQVIEDILNSFENVRKNKNIIFNYTLADIIISADKMRLKQVMFNLISNALKFSKENSIVSIVTYVNDNKEFIFEIQDKGKGISKKDLSEIFNFFTQNQQEGSGIGLALCRRILQAHGGDIYVKSKLNEGSTFRFSVPLKN